MGVIVVITGRWPTVGALTFLLVAFLSLPWIDPSSFPLALIPLSALVARYCSWQFSGVAGGLTAAWLALMVELGHYVWVNGALYFSLLLFGAALGASLKAAAKRTARLSHEVSVQEKRRDQAVSDERKRIAAELHDVVAHDLTIIAMQARVLDTATRPEDLAEARQAIGDASRQALKDMRRMLGVLYGPGAAGSTAEAEETTGGLILRVREFAGLLQAQGIQVEVDVPADLMVPRSLELTLIRIAQEATTNILKHASGAPWARYAVESLDRSITLTISNAAPTQHDHDDFPSSGFGLVGLRERASVYGGNIETGPIAGGWCVRATFETAAA
jgi:signal transduction histidine kinase